MSLVLCVVLLSNLNSVFWSTTHLDAVPEGTVVFPHEPLLRVQGPVWQAQILETAILNIVNFQTLAATKAARVCEAANGEPVLEFGLRRAHGVDPNPVAADFESGGLH